MRKSTSVCVLCVVMAFFCVSSAAGPETNQLGVLDLTANSGINPYTGWQWQVGDIYRLVFMTTETNQPTSTDIADYNAFVQTAASNSSSFPNLADVTWKVIGSTETVNALVNTASAPGDPDDCAIFLPNSALLADSFADLWDGYARTSVNISQNNIALPKIVGYGWANYGASAFTGTSDAGGTQSPLGGDGDVYTGLSTESQSWCGRGTNAKTYWHHYYAMSPTLTIQGDNVVYNRYGVPRSSTSGDLVGRVVATSLTVDVSVYWSTNDNVDSSAWLADTSASNAFVGTYPNPYELSISKTVSNLQAYTQYYYAFVATNATTNIWSQHANGIYPSLQTFYWDGGTNDIAGNGDGTSDGGAGTWNTSITNWDVGSGVPYLAWDNGADGWAVLDGSSGTVIVDENINIGKLDVRIQNYTVGGTGTLNFASGGIITNNNNRLGNLTITCPISNSPDVHQVVGNNKYLTFAPTSGNQALGIIYRHTDDYLEFNGSTPSNTIDSVVLVGGQNRPKVRFNGTGHWTVGDIGAGNLDINSGVVCATGTFTSTYAVHNLNSGGTLLYNNGDLIGTDNKFSFKGGAFDNTTGSAITGSTLNKNYYFQKDTMFIGSLGASSDLNLGTGTATLDAVTTLRTDIDITVSNSLTTLTIGGAVADGGSGDGLKKSGAGRLVLMGANTYTGVTIINDGILDVRDAQSLTNCSSLQFLYEDGALRLENADKPGGAGQWDWTAFSTLNTNILVGFDAASGSNLTFSNVVGVYTDVRGIIPYPVSTAYWDGNDTTDDADGGAGIWNNTSNNWDDAEIGGSDIAWDENNSSNDTAIFGGSGGEVALASDAYLRKLETQASGYRIGTDDETHVLRFVDPDPTITLYEDNVYIKAGITGSPDVTTDRGNYGSGVDTHLQANVEPMTLGWIYRLTDDYHTFEGTNTGNTIQGYKSYHNRAKVYFKGSGTWTVNGLFHSGEGLELYNNVKVYLNGLTYCDWTSHAAVRFNSFTGTIGGTGVISNNSAQTISFPAACTLAPGNPTGTMTITNGSCTVGGTFAVTINGSAYSSLAVGGTLDVSAATLDLDVTSASESEYVIASSTSAIVGPFNGTNGLPNSKWVVSYDNPNQIVIIPPAAGTMIMVK